MENGKENKTGYRVEQDSIGEKDIPGDFCLRFPLRSDR